MVETVIESVTNLVSGAYTCAVECPVTVNSTNIKYKLYPRTDPLNSYEIDPTNPCNQDMASGEKIIFVVSGWMMDTIRPWMTDMKNNYTQYENKNVIFLDWDVVNINSNYFQSQACVEAVGELIHLKFFL